MTKEEAEVIEYKTWPYNIDQWKREKDRLFYLELFGETSPRITPGYTQLPLPEENEISRHSTNLAPLYEYYWSLGYVDIDKKCGPAGWGGNPKETAAEVYMYFPTTGGWWIQELVATVKYLIPGTEHLSVLKHVADLFATAQPIVEDVSKIASAGSGLPGVGPI